jgi:DNA-binding NtrC family response regulator
MRILIVEDDASLRLMLRDLVESLGHSVDEATNATDALAMLQGDDELELVLLDLGLPPAPQDISEGVRFLTALASWNSHRKVIVISGQSHEDAQKCVVEFGAMSMLTKPFKRDHLEFAINQAELWLRNEKKLREDDQKYSVMVVADASSEEGLKAAREAVMVKLIRNTLAETNFNVSETSRRLNISRENLYYFMKRFNIVRPDE